MASKTINLITVVSPFLTAKTTKLNLSVKDGVVAVTKILPGKKLADKPLVTFPLDKKTVLVGATEADLAAQAELPSLTAGSLNITINLSDGGAYFLKSFEVIEQAEKPPAPVVKPEPKKASLSGRGCSTMPRARYS